MEPRPDETIAVTEPPELVKAVELCRTDRTDKEWPNREQEAIKIFKQICHDRHAEYDIETRYNAFVEFSKYVPDIALDEMARFGQLLQFSQNPNAIDFLLEFFKNIGKGTGNPNIPPMERLRAMTTLYSNGFVEECYDGYKAIALDVDLSHIIRVDACRYLFIKEDDMECKEIAQEVLFEITTDPKICAETRYGYITEYITQCGIKPIMLSTNQQVMYDEEFVCGLQYNFFTHEKEAIRERILSGQNLLQMLCTTDEVKQEIADKLMKYVYNRELIEDIRADAADVVSRLGPTKSYRELAIAAIREIGRENAKSDTVYENSQNIHNSEIRKRANDYIVKMITEDELNYDFEKTNDEISEMIKRIVIDPDEFMKAMYSLYRIRIDTATFTDIRVTIGRILMHVWHRVKKHRNEFPVLEQRVCDELIDMSGTCSSGHSFRLANVLSIVDADIQISWEDQVIANFDARMQSRLMKDKQAETLAMSMMDDASLEEKQAMIDFTVTNAKEVVKELEGEFVLDGYTSSKDFDEYIIKAREAWDKKNNINYDLGGDQFTTTVNDGEETITKMKTLLDNNNEDEGTSELAPES